MGKFQDQDVIDTIGNYVHDKVYSILNGEFAYYLDEKIQQRHQDILNETSRDYMSRMAIFREELRYHPIIKSL